MSVPFSSQMLCRNKTFVDITFWFNIWKGCRAPTGCVLMEKVHTAETKDPWEKTNLINLVALPTIPQCWCCWGLFHEILPYQRLGKTQMQPRRYMASLAPGNGSISGLCKSRFTFCFRGFLWILASRINQTVGMELRFSKIPVQSVPTSQSWITLNLSILQ